jgi:hypothetical protein
MKNLFLIATAIVAVGGVTSFTAAAYAYRPTFDFQYTYGPTFELTGFPITPHQVAVLGAARVEERAAPSMLTFGGMPITPHQLDVLISRSKPARKVVERSSHPI